jgi:hypothetical protein
LTLRIVSTTVRNGSVVELHGWLNGPEVAEFEKVCAGRSASLQIDLTHLVGADAAGILSLREQRARGARLIGVSPYISLLLQDLQGP